MSGRDCSVGPRKGLRHLPNIWSKSRSNTCTNTSAHGSDDDGNLSFLPRFARRNPCVGPAVLNHTRSGPYKSVCSPESEFEARSPVNIRASFQTGLQWCFVWTLGRHKPDAGRPDHRRDCWTSVRRTSRGPNRCPDRVLQQGARAPVAQEV